MRQYVRGLESLPLSDPARIAGYRDLNQLNQTTNLYKTGKANSAVGAAYTEANRLNPAQQGYMDMLAKRGVTREKLISQRLFCVLCGVQISEAAARVLRSSHAGHRSRSAWEGARAQPSAYGRAARSLRLR